MPIFFLRQVLQQILEMECAEHSRQVKDIIRISEAFLEDIITKSLHFAVEEKLA